MNLKQIRSRVQTNLTSQFILNYGLHPAVIDSVINQIYLRCAFDGDAVGNTFTLTTVPNQFSYALDDSFLLIQRVYYDFQSASGSIDLGDDLEEISYRSEEGAAEYGVPDSYWLEQPHNGKKAKIYFYPIPSEAKVVRVKAITYPNLLSGDEDLVEMSQIFDEVIIHGATAELGAIGEGIPRLAYFERRYQEGLRRASDKLSLPSRRGTTKVPYRETWD